jgi:hypothetical protein
MKKLVDFQQRFNYMNWLNKDISFHPRIKKALVAYKPLDQDWVWKASELGGDFIVATFGYLNYSMKDLL